MNKLIISFLWICELVLKPNHNDLMLPKLSKSRVRLYPSKFLFIVPSEKESSRCFSGSVSIKESNFW